MCDPYSKYHMFGEVEESPFWHSRGPLWPHFATPGRPLGPPGSHLATDSNFERFPGESLITFGDPFGTQNHKNRDNSVNKLCSESVLEKVSSRSSPETAQCVIRTVNTICLERSRSVHLGGFWPRFGSLLGLCWVTFWKK